MWQQIWKGDAAYDYEALAESSTSYADYGVEQQAQIVEDGWESGVIKDIDTARFVTSHGVDITDYFISNVWFPVMGGIGAP